MSQFEVFLLLSLCAQAVVVALAVRLAVATHHRIAWGLAALVFLLMAGRTVATLVGAMTGDARLLVGGSTAEAIALVTSLLSLVALIVAGRVYRRSSLRAEAICDPTGDSVQHASAHRQLVERVPVGMAVLTEGAIVFTNRSFAGLLGAGRETLIGRSLISVVEPDQRADLEHWTTVADRDDSSVLGDRRWRFVGDDGEARWVALRGRDAVWEGKPSTLLAAVDITDWQRATEELEESEAKFRALTESAASAIFIFQGEEIVYVNRRAEEISGYNRSELLGMPFWKTIHPDFQTSVRSRGLARQQGEDAPPRYQVKLRRKDGSECWVDFTAAAMQFRGEPAVIGTAFDVTDLRDAEEELRRHHEHLEELVRERSERLEAAEETFRALAESSQDVIMRFDREYRHLYASPIVESQTGIPAADFIGKTHKELSFPGELVSVWEAAIESVFAGRAPSRVEFKLPTDIWIDWLLIPEFTADGEVRSVITTARDITERKRAEEELRRHKEHLEELVAERTALLEARNDQLRREIAERERVEQALRESEARFRSLHDSVAIGLYRTTPDGRVLMANPAFARMLGFSSFEELAAINLEEEQGFYRNMPRRAGLDLIEAEGGVRGLEWELRRRDGESIYVRETASATRDADGNVLYYEGALEDVTERRRLEEQLRQALKMQAIGHLAGGVAHDFNNLLMAIMGPVELLRRRLAADDAAQSELDVIHRSATRAAELTRGLLAFASRQVLAPRSLDLSVVVHEMLPMLSRVIPENIDIEFAPEPGLSELTADRGQLEQVIMNLCLNARDAMRDGGKIVITARAVEPDESFRSQQDGRVHDRYALLSIRDTGCGMDADTLERVYEPFFSTKEPGRGTGMGLATVYGIVRQHDGVIEISSAPGTGTECRIYLPLGDPRTSDLPPPSVPPTSGGHETILVTEDDAEVRQVLVSMLSGLGYSVLEAGDGVEALEILRLHAPAVDLVITDVVMPRMGGAELHREAQEVIPAARFLFSSGYAQSVLESEDLDRTKSHFIAKPYGIDDLARKVREILDPQKPGSSTG